MRTEDAAFLIEGVEPELAIVTHFGLRLIREGVEVQTRYIEEHSGIKTIGAEDLMSVSVGKTIRSRTFSAGRRADDFKTEPLNT